MSMRKITLLMPVGYCYSEEQKLLATRVFCLPVIAELAKSNLARDFLILPNLPVINFFEITAEPYFYNTTTLQEYCVLSCCKPYASESNNYGLDVTELNKIFGLSAISRVINNKEPSDNIYQLIAPFYCFDGGCKKFDVSGTSILVGYNDYKICKNKTEFFEAVKNIKLGNCEIDKDIIKPVERSAYVTSYLPDTEIPMTQNVNSITQLNSLGYLLPCAGKTANLRLASMPKCPQIVIPDAVQYLTVETSISSEFLICPKDMQYCHIFALDILNISSPEVCSYFCFSGRDLNNLILPKKLEPKGYYKNSQFHLNLDSLASLASPLDQSEYYELSENFVLVPDMLDSLSLALSEHGTLSCHSIKNIIFKNTGVKQAIQYLEFKCIDFTVIELPDDIDNLQFIVSSKICSPNAVLIFAITGTINQLNISLPRLNGSLDIKIIGTGKIKCLYVNNVQYRYSCYVPVESLSVHLRNIGVIDNHNEIFFNLASVPSFTICNNSEFRLDLDKNYELLNNSYVTLNDEQFPLADVNKLLAPVFTL